MAAGELGLLLNGHRSYGSWKDAVPNRSGSAPPTMEGSLAAVGNLIGQRNLGYEGSLTNFSNSVENCESEEQLRADPAYLAYYCSNVNLNPRLPRPLISQENRRLVHHFGDNWRMVSLDDSSNGSFFLSRPVLSTHKEEPEDDKSPGLASSDSHRTAPPEGRHQSPVDLIQEDFPRTPSPLYDNHSYPSICKSTEETAVGACINPLHDSSTSMAESSELRIATTAVRSRTPTPSLSSIRPGSSNDFSATSSPSSSYSERNVRLHPGLKGDLISGKNNLDNEAIVKGAAVLGIGSINSEMKALRISYDGHRSQPAKQHPHRSNLRQEASKQIHGDQSQMISLTPTLQNAWENFPHGQSRLSSVEVQPVLHSDGATQPFYTTATAYGNPFYPSLQPTSFFPPQYNLGYALSASFVPPIMTGYSPHTAIPVPIDDRTSLNMNARPSGAGVGGNITAGAELMQQYKLYGHLGVAMQPPVPDPMYVQYFQHSSLNTYSGGPVVGNLADSYDPQRVLSSAAYSTDQRPQFLGNGSVSKSSNTQGGALSASYQWNSPYMGVLTSYPTSPLPSPVASPLPNPVFHGSPLPVTSLSRRRNENIRVSHSSGRNVAASSGRLGQREREKVDDLKSYSFLDELKSNRTRRYELFDIAGRIVEFSADQHGSRFIQQKLETCSIEEKASVFQEVLPYASTLTTDVFGNYVIQKFFEHGSPDQRRQLANQLTGRVLPLSLQMYGCRVIQKALEVIEVDQKTQLVRELDGNVMRCVCDQNGNHVIQKCIECVPTEKIGFVISAFHGQVALLSKHPYGCRVIQRVLEHCTDELQSQCIVDEILQSACSLAEDQYGNYVTQHVLERGNLRERSQIISTLAGQVVRLSQNKFASNVIEKCLEHGDDAERDLLIEEIVGQTEGNDNLLTMMKDQFANYVVQKILEICTDKQREILLTRIRVHLPSLKKYTYGKHIVARVEQLFGEGIHAQES